VCVCVYDLTGNLIRGAADLADESGAIKIGDANCVGRGSLILKAPMLVPGVFQSVCTMNEGWIV